MSLPLILTTLLLFTATLIRIAAKGINDVYVTLPALHCELK